MTDCRRVPEKAIIWWKRSSNMAQPKDISFRAKDYVLDLPRLVPSPFLPQGLCLQGGDVKKVEAPYPPPIVMSSDEAYMASYLAREYFRRDTTGDELQSFSNPSVAIGRALACGESVCLSRKLPSAHFLSIARKWGAVVIIKEFRLS